MWLPPPPPLKPSPAPADTGEPSSPLPLPLARRYCRFYQGRRTPDDERQIGRWAGIAGPRGRWRNNLIAKVVAAGADYNDASVSPVVRQTLQHWGYDLTQADFTGYAKKVVAGARTSYIRGGVVVPAGKHAKAAVAGAGTGTKAAKPAGSGSGGGRSSATGRRRRRRDDSDDDSDDESEYDGSDDSEDSDNDDK